MRLSFFLVTILLTAKLFATSLPQEVPNYYGSEFASRYTAKNIQNEELRNLLFTIVSSGHIQSENAADQIVPGCDSANTKCEQHRPLGYDSARTKLFGELFLQQLADGKYGVRDVYCDHMFTDADFGGVPSIGPGMLPKQGNIVNTEHTWPQARFTGRFPRETQKSDLHHLFPTDSQANSHRGSLHFGFIVDEMEPQKCKGNKLGRGRDGIVSYEVPDAQKGNAARAIFYFATRYQMKVSPAEEAALRDWHKLDPVDEAELDRNNKIEKLQGNRNPYIDMPDLVDRIDHF